MLAMWGGAGWDGSGNGAVRVLGGRGWDGACFVWGRAGWDGSGCAGGWGGVRVWGGRGWLWWGMWVGLGGGNGGGGVGGMVGPTNSTLRTFFEKRATNPKTGGCLSLCARIDVRSHEGDMQVFQLPDHANDWAG